MAEYSKEQLELKQLASECVEEGLTRLLEGRLEESETMLTRGSSIFDELGEKRECASAMNLLSIVYDEMANESASMESLLVALDNAIDVNAYDLVAKVYNNLGSKFMSMHSYERALFYFKCSLDRFEKASKENIVSEYDAQAFALVMNMNLSTVYCHTGDYGKAKYYYELAKEKSTHPLCEDLYFSFQCFEGLTLWRVGQKEKARSLVSSIMDGVKATEYVTEYLEITADFLKLLSEMEDFENWEKALEQIGSRLSEGSGLLASIEMKKRWIEFYKASGKTEEYQKACMEFFELSQEKEFADFSKRADILELRADNHQAKRQNELNKDRVYRDTLTGIGNRNSMIRDSAEYIETSARDRSSITIGLIDVDFFKECNDTYGHIEGDECLKKVAKVIKDSLKGDGNVYRFGGDEFLVLIPDYSKEQILELGKEIKEKLEALKISNDKSPISSYVTVSQGYTQAIADEGDTIDYLVNLADRVLYKVKRRGKNDFIFIDHKDVID